MKLEAWSVSDIGLVRKSNQDAIGCFPELRLFVVADGMGGREGGEIASRMAVDVIHEVFAQRAAAASADGAAAKAPGLVRRAWQLLAGGGRDGQAADAAEKERLRVAVELANQRIHVAGKTE